MADWNGKKTHRVLLRVSEEMAITVKALAELNHRAIQDELRFLIARGLEHSLGQRSKVRTAPPRQRLSIAEQDRQEKSA